MSARFLAVSMLDERIADFSLHRGCFIAPARKEMPRLHGDIITSENGAFE